jgi:hypothetical protein
MREATGAERALNRAAAGAAETKEKAPDDLHRSGLTLNEANLLAGCTCVRHFREFAKFLPGLLYRYTLLRGFPWGLAITCHQANATWIW